VASVAEEACCSFDDVAQALEVISCSSPPLSPVQGSAGGVEGDFNAAGAGLLASAIARGSLTASSYAPRISDLTAAGTKVGPLLPARLSTAAPSVASHDSTLQWGSGGGAPAGAAAGTESPRCTSPAAFKSAKMSSAVAAAASAAGAGHAAAGVRLPSAAGAGQQQGGQGSDAVQGRDAVQNPLYEDADGESCVPPCLLHAAVGRYCICIAQLSSFHLSLAMPVCTSTNCLFDLAFAVSLQLLQVRRPRRCWRRASRPWRARWQRRSKQAQQQGLLLVTPFQQAKLRQVPVKLPGLLVA
jgi:hypothetical protein